MQQYLTKLLARRLRNILDLIVLSASYWAAFALRFDGELPFQMWKRLLFTWPYVVAFEFAVLALFSIPRFSWRHVGLREAVRVGWATLTIAGVLLAIRLGADAVRMDMAYAIYAVVPIGVIANNFVLSLAGIVGVRSIRRVTFERSVSLRCERPHNQMIPTLLIGAGQAGALAAREIEKRRDLGIRPVGFLDDDSSKTGLLVHGIKVWGPVDRLDYFARRTAARQVLVTIAEIGPSELRRIVKLCENERLRVKVMPGLYQVIAEQAGAVGRPRDVSIEDLLGRESVRLNMQLVRSFLRGKRVLVTGAGGSIGSELCRQVARYEPASLVLVERSEYALFTIHRELLQSDAKDCLMPRLCDVCDSERLEHVFATDRPQIVFHAAAHKHVPLMEQNPGEAVKNNVFGSKQVADASDRHGVEAFVLISTDKAVNPTSVMGATKRVTEIYTQALSARSKTKYVAVRFGNVLGSAGSVIPTFMEQINAGGPITVTHPDMRRYFMTIPEASQLVMQAGAMGKGGEIFALDMGEPVRIVDLAHDLIRLRGLVPDVDVPIEFVGMRPGEKLFEELGFDAEQMDKTSHPKIYIGKLQPAKLEAVRAQLQVLARCTSSDSETEVREALRAMVPEMIPPHSVNQPIPRAKTEPERVPPQTFVGAGPKLAVSSAR